MICGGRCSRPGLWPSRDEHQVSVHISWAWAVHAVPYVCACLKWCDSSVLCAALL